MYNILRRSIGGRVLNIEGARCSILRQEPRAEYLFRGEDGEEMLQDFLQRHTFAVGQFDGPEGQLAREEFQRAAGAAECGEPGMEFVACDHSPDVQGVDRSAVEGDEERGEGSGERSEERKDRLSVSERGKEGAEAFRNILPRERPAEGCGEVGGEEPVLRRGAGGHNALPIVGTSGRGGMPPQRKSLR